MAKKRTIWTQFKRPGQYVIRHLEWLESDAYRSLSLTARCLLEEFQIVYRPGRNGRLVLPVLTAAERLGVCENTARKAFDELLGTSFIAISEEADWTNGRAREYRLTIEQYKGCEPTDEWPNWTPDAPIWRARRGTRRK